MAEKNKQTETDPLYILLDYFSTRPSFKMCFSIYGHLFKKATFRFLKDGLVVK